MFDSTTGREIAVYASASGRGEGDRHQYTMTRRITVDAGTTTRRIAVDDGDTTGIAVGAGALGRLITITSSTGKGIAINDGASGRGIAAKSGSTGDAGFLGRGINTEEGAPR